MTTSFCTENNVYLTKDDLRQVIPVLYWVLCGGGGSLKDLFYIYKFRLLQIQEFCTYVASFLFLVCYSILGREGEEPAERGFEKNLRGVTVYLPSPTWDLGACALVPLQGLGY